MTIIPVSGGAFAAYDVVVGRGLLAQAGAHIAPLAKGRTVIITDETVAAIHAQALTASLTALAPHLAAGTPIVGLEPSCTAVLRRDARLVGSSVRGGTCCCS